MWPDLLDFSLWLCKLEIIIVPAHRGLLRALSEWIYETHSTWLALNFICSIYYYWYKYFLQDSCSEKKVLDSVAKDTPHFPHRYSPTWRLPRVASSSVSTLPQWNTVPHLPQETAVAMNETHTALYMVRDDLKDTICTASISWPWPLLLLASPTKWFLMINHQQSDFWWQSFLTSLLKNFQWFPFVCEAGVLIGGQFCHFFPTPSPRGWEV